MHHVYAMIYFFMVTWRIIRALSAADSANGTPKELEKYIRLQAMEMESCFFRHANETDANSQHTTTRRLEVLKHKTRRLSQIIDYITYDDVEHPIKIIGIRADFNLLQGFVFGMIGAALTGLEVLGIDIF